MHAVVAAAFARTRPSPSAILQNAACCIRCPHSSRPFSPPAIPSCSIARHRPRHLSTTTAAVATHARPMRRPLLLTLAGLGLASAGYYAGADSSSARSLNPDTFSPYTLASATPISSAPTQTSVFTFVGGPPSPSDPDVVQSVQLKQPELQIARHYTPLPPDGTSSGNSGGADMIRLLVKREPAGEVSKYLFNVSTGDSGSAGGGGQVFLRGPFAEYRLPSGRTQLLFLAGGTGVAPALQAADKLLRRADGSHLALLWAVRHRGEAGGVVAEELRVLEQRFPGKFAVAVYADDEGGLKRGVVERELDRMRMGKDEKSEVVVSGPDGFVAYWAGPKLFIAGKEEQGMVGGVIGEALRRRVRGGTMGEVGVWKL